jgi:4-hydroxybenzoate polyprenyltransferase
MQPYLKLVRIPNLVFIAFIQFVMRQAVIIPILQMFGFDATIPTDGL